MQQPKHPQAPIPPNYYKPVVFDSNEYLTLGNLVNYLSTLPREYSYDFVDDEMQIYFPNPEYAEEDAEYGNRMAQYKLELERYQEEMCEYRIWQTEKELARLKKK